MGRVARIELLARYHEAPAGWDVWGDDVTSTIKKTGALFTRIKKPVTIAARGKA